jgi:hypothetical protein
MDEFQLKKIIDTLIDGLREEKIADKELNNAVGAAVAALTYQLVPLTIMKRYENGAEVIKKAEEDEALEGDGFDWGEPQYDIADGISPIFYKIKEAIGYCDRNCLPLTLIRQYDYEEENFEIHLFGEPTEEDEKIATDFFEKKEIK